MKRLWWALALLGCDDGETGGATAPDQGIIERTCEDRAVELRAQCPPGSDPLIGAAATVECQGAARELTDADGAVRGICEARDGCLVVCNFQDPCVCGIDRITDEGVFCAECTAGCGNQICEGGESPQTCPEDCGSACTPGAERCADQAREICEVDGDWGRAACRADQACAVLERVGLTFCQTRVSPDGGAWVAPGGAPVELAGAPAEIRFQEGTICQTCEPLRFIEGGARVLVLDQTAVRIIDPGDGAVENTPFTITGAFAAVEDHIATSARLPVVVDRARDTTFTAEAFVDDTTDVESGAVALTPDGRGLAVAMAVQDAPLVALWDTAVGEARHLLRFVDMAVASNEQASALAFSPNGRLLVEARAGGLMVVWNVEEGRYVHLIQTDLRSAADLAFSPTGAPLLLAAGDGVELWDLEAAERRWRLETQSSGVDITGDGAVFASQEGGAALRFMIDGSQARRLDGAGRVHFSSDGSRLMVGRVIYRDTF